MVNPDQQQIDTYFFAKVQFRQEQQNTQKPKAWKSRLVIKRVKDPQTKQVTEQIVKKDKLGFGDWVRGRASLRNIVKVCNDKGIYSKALQDLITAYNGKHKKKVDDLTTPPPTHETPQKNNVVNETPPKEIPEGLKVFGDFLKKTDENTQTLVLNAEVTKHLTDDNLPQLLQQFPHAQEVRIEGSSEMKLSKGDALKEIKTVTLQNITTPLNIEAFKDGKIESLTLKHSPNIPLSGTTKDAYVPKTLVTLIIEQNITTNDLTKISNQCPPLKELSLTNVTITKSDTNFEAKMPKANKILLDNCKGVDWSKLTCTELTIKNCDEFGDTEAASLPNTLTALTLENCSKLTNKGFENIQKKCPHVPKEPLIQEGFTRLLNTIKDADTWSIDINILTQLAPEQLQKISTLTNLKTCTVTGTTTDSEITKKLLEALPTTLTSLTIASIRDEDFEKLPRFSNLQTLTISNPSVTGKAFDQLPASITKLVCANTQVSDDNIQKLAEKKELKHLNLNNSKITGATLHFLPQSVRTLSCNNIEPFSLTEEFRKLPIQHLSLNEVTLSLESSHNLPPTLETVHLKGAQLSDESTMEDFLYYALLNENRIQTLDVSETDVTCSRFLSPDTKLEILVIQNCSQIKNLNIPSLPNNLKKLYAMQTSIETKAPQQDREKTFQLYVDAPTVQTLNRIWSKMKNFSSNIGTYSSTTFN